MPDEELTLTILIAKQQATRALKAVRELFNRFGRGIKNVFKSVGAAIGRTLKGIFSLRGAIGVLAGAGGLLALVKSAANAGDELAKMSQSLGIGVEALSALKFQAQLAGTSFESAATGIKRLSANMFDASNGMGEAKEAFKELGIEVKNEDGTLKSSEEVMGEIADRFSQMEDGAKKTAIAMDLFGRAGAELIPLLNAGKEALEAQAEQAEALGIVWSEESAASAEEFNDSLTILGGGLEGIRNFIGSTLMPILTDFNLNVLSPLIDRVREWIKTNRGLIDQKFTAFLQGIIDVFERIDFGAIIDHIQEVFNGISDFVGGFDGLINKIETIADAALSVVDTFRSIFSGIRQVINVLGNFGTSIGQTLGSAAVGFSQLGATSPGISGRQAIQTFTNFHNGVDFVPRDMPANLQRGERVVSAADNRRIDSRRFSFAFNGGGPSSQTEAAFMLEQAQNAVDRQARAF